MRRSYSHPNLFRAFLISGLFILLCVSCSGKSFDASQATPTPIPTPNLPSRPTYPVHRGEMISELKYSGRLVPVTKQELAFTSGGRVAKVYVQSGEAVTQGQLLAELESGQSEYDLRRAQVNLEIAQLKLELARIQTPQTSAAYTVTVAIQEQEVALAQIALDELIANYDTMRLTTPISGTVLSISIAEGAMVEASKPVIVVATLDDLIVGANMSADDMSLLTIGMTVTVDSIGRNIPSVEGAIQSLPYPYGSADAQQTGSSVLVALDPPPVELGYKVGDMVNLTIVLQKKADTLWLPSQAVREFEGRYFVIVQEGEVQRRVDVKVGIIEVNRIEILEGLTEGQVVVAP
jgi:RND family efflux transporter MFP subunit